IRLQVEPGAAGRLSIMGQVLDEDDPGHAPAQVAVRALEGDRTLDRALTNALGEFQLEPRRSKRLQLSVDVPEIGTFTVETDPPPGGGARGGGSMETGGRPKRARPH